MRYQSKLFLVFTGMFLVFLLIPQSHQRPLAPQPSVADPVPLRVLLLVERLPVDAGRLEHMTSAVSRIPKAEQ